MRHANDEDLDRLDGLLAELRKLQPLRERKRGSFSRGSKALLHFHAEAEDFYVDVRLDTAFERMRVTTLEERHTFLGAVRSSLQLALD